MGNVAWERKEHPWVNEELGRQTLSPSMAHQGGQQNPQLHPCMHCRQLMAAAALPQFPLAHSTHLPATAYSVGGPGLR